MADAAAATEPVPSNSTSSSATPADAHDHAPASAALHGEHTHTGRARVAFSRFRLSADLLRWLREEEVLTCTEPELGARGFDKCVDYPQLPGHKYHEGYFHGLPSARAVDSLHPRRGHEFSKPAAPPRLRAFLTAFRRLNAHWIAPLAEAPGAPAPWEELVRSDACFGDMALQVHHGDAVQGADLGWHKDSFNSVLHMAISFRGRRALHSKLSADAGAAELGEVVEWMEEGDVYVSSPYSFRHSVEYPASTWENRTVAAQCRLLLSAKQMNAVYEHMHTGRLGSVQEAVTRALEAQQVAMPTLKDVQAELAGLGKDGRCALM